MKGVCVSCCYLIHFIIIINRSLEFKQNDSIVSRECNILSVATYEVWVPKTKQIFLFYRRGRIYSLLYLATLDCFATRLNFLCIKKRNCLWVVGGRDHNEFSLVFQVNFIFLYHDDVNLSQNFGPDMKS